MISGVGTDLCRIERIARAMENPRFTERIFTPAERARLDNLCAERRAERAAGMFAAKEAVAKALGTGFTGFGFSDIEILADEKGRPLAQLHDGAAELAKGEGGKWVRLFHGKREEAVAVIYRVAGEEKTLLVSMTESMRKKLIEQWKTAKRS